MAHDLIPELGVRLVAATDPRPGERVLDIAAGTGNAAIPAARTGADVVASDLTPRLLETGRGEAEREGVSLTWEVGDAEALPYADGEFDVVLSCVGVMFAPRHERAAAELLRVTRPGGRVGLVSWTPTGFVGQLFATMKPFSPPPPPGSTPPPLWGAAEHVEELLGAGLSDLATTRHTVAVDRFTGRSDFREYFAANYGPTRAVYASLAGSPERVAQLDDALDDLAARHGVGSGTSVMEWEYLLVTGTRVG